MCVDGRERIRKCGRFACANRSLADQGAGEPSRTRELPQTNGDRGEPRRVPSPTGPYPAGVRRFRRFRSEAIAARRRSVRSDRGEDDDSRPRVSLPGKSSRSRISPRARRSRSVGRPSRLSPVGGTRRYPAASARYLALDIESADIDCEIESVSDRCLPPRLPVLATEAGRVSAPEGNQRVVTGLQRGRPGSASLDLKLCAYAGRKLRPTL